MGKSDFEPGQSIQEAKTPGRQSSKPEVPQKLDAIKTAEKKRLAEALRENLKRRKAQISARRHATGPNEHID